MKKVLITGGNGQLAKSFKNKYSSQFEIISLSKDKLNISSENDIKMVISNYSPDIIINCAALTNVDECEANFKKAKKINSIPIKNFAKYFKGLFIQISTDYVFDGKYGPYDEKDKINPINNYGKSKLLAEKYTIEYFKNFLILRTNILFDYDSKSSFLTWVVNSSKSVNEIKVVHDQYNNPIWVDDMSSIISKSIKKNLRGLYHIGSSKIISRYEFAKLINEVFELDYDKIHKVDSSYLKLPAKRPKLSGLISNKIIKDLNIEPIDLYQSLKRLKDKIN
tara:strand:+ start:1455 stop:2291 length:837 start_codon:yes stop_codon:yes gene_type:complete